MPARIKQTKGCHDKMHRRSAKAKQRRQNNCENAPRIPITGHATAIFLNESVCRAPALQREQIPKLRNLLCFRSMQVARSHHFGLPRRSVLSFSHSRSSARFRKSCFSRYLEGGGGGEERSQENAGKKSNSMAMNI